MIFVLWPSALATLCIRLAPLPTAPKSGPNLLFPVGIDNQGGSNERGSSYTDGVATGNPTEITGACSRLVKPISVRSCERVFVFIHFVFPSAEFKLRKQSFVLCNSGAFLSRVSHF